jgi:ParB-like chromosome segregation protein Spo0J
MSEQGEAINMAIGDRPALEWVPIAAIGVDSSYQRELKPALVAKILSKFSWAKFGAVVLARHEDGRFTVVEGQHRVKAAELHPNVEAVPAVVVSHQDVKGEAESFLAINRDRMAVGTVEQYWAGLTAGDEKMAAIARVLAAASCDATPTTGDYAKPNHTGAIGAVGRSLERFGHGATRRALLIIRAAWPDERKTLRGSLIQALARIVRANEKVLADADMVAALRRESIAKLTAHAEAFKKMSGGSAEAALAKALVELHNKGRRVNTIQLGEAR